MIISVLKLFKQIILTIISLTYNLNFFVSPVILIGYCSITMAWIALLANELVQKEICPIILLITTGVNESRTT